MLIGGELVASQSGEYDYSISPVDERVIGRTPAATEQDVDRAVRAAEAAWPAWAALSPLERGEAMRAFGDAIAARAQEILEVEVADTGNTITPMRGDVGVAIDSLRYYAGIAHELKGQTIPATSENLHLTVREPYGVVVRIVPFNHPIMFAVARTAAALAAGNAVIVKPPETSPLSAMILAEIARDTLPPGIFNIVTGSGRVAGDALVRHPVVKRIAFIGSVPTGRAIQRAAAESGVKHVTLELGGKNPMIVFPDNDADAIAQAAIGGMNFSWQGQSCGSTSRLLVHDALYDAVVERVAARMGLIRVGDPHDPATGMGPLNSKVQHDKVLGFIADAKCEGARLIFGGGRPQGEDFSRGFWVEPTVFADVTPSMRLWREEVFGPILSIARWSDVDEVVDLANSTEFGLTAAIWTSDVKAALSVAKRVRSGHVWINGCSRHFLGVPFGGMSSSGVGREEGIEEMLSYTELKTINVML
ncbi:aldehyde dehydrogenase [Sphingomonas sp. Root710]|uniref:aldehyde dehydrogenase family protein n=1 Tax=Sphingomonas sp. Root710 TaxID=1736594 RepID=UPI0006FF121C|nr:aldehyde dehydrogenase family protein [Sphingomonas sp. Root710]KRB78903.1 aldehyde dehydrogenase [Sphingomonas sp. Root710]